MDRLFNSGWMVAVTAFTLSSSVVMGPSGMRDLGAILAQEALRRTASPLFGGTGRGDEGVILKGGSFPSTFAGLPFGHSGRLAPRNARLAIIFLADRPRSYCVEGCR